MRYIIFNDWTGEISEIVDVASELDAVRRCGPGEACIPASDGADAAFAVDPDTRTVKAGPAART